MKLKFTKQFVPILVCLLAAAAAFAQQRNPVDIATAHVNSHLTEWGLTAQDIEGMTVSDQYTDKTTGIARVYFQQRYHGIPVYNAIQNVTISAKGEVFYTGKRFHANLVTKTNTVIPVLSAADAVQKAAEHLGLEAGEVKLARKISDMEYVFEKGSISQHEITVKLMYQPRQGSILLCWNVGIEPVGTSDMWNIRIDAVTSGMLDKNNFTVYCHFGPKEVKKLDTGSKALAAETHEHITKGLNPPAFADASYNIWPLPAESPIHGARSVVTNPADPIASPFGWHDTDGVDGAEYTITRGNNVHAYQDTSGLNSSIGDEPDGGPNLNFDFSFDPGWEPIQYMPTAVVNLFYMNNVMHDFAHHYGFDEAAGNFQTKNYGNGSGGGDAVRAEAQDGSGTDNANFSTPDDGSPGRMQMFLWGTAGAKYLQVNEPQSVAGLYITKLAANGTAGNWGDGAFVTDVPVTGEVVFVEDGVGVTTDGCNPLLNAAAIQGKIAMIDRGSCEFGFKAKAAQDAGAIAVIICDIPGATVTNGMGPGAAGSQVNIPVVMISVENCQTLRQFAGSGLNVTLVKSTQPSQQDGDLDNGIIAHEYGHGISNRLTGGPSNSGCLNNAEQMGEGWSDFMSLITTTKPGDTPEKLRAVGTYVVNGDVTGAGIRIYPYTTDMGVNLHTYKDIASYNGEVHNIGEVWTSMLWDMYWGFVEEYGYDPDLYNGTGGNNMAIRLVFEGMKIQPCSPGFLDGRDAILQADELLYNGVNKCIIWKAFGRRGAGVSASQGDPNNSTDQVEAFDIPHACINAITIDKTVTELIDAGDDIEVKVVVGNYRQETATGVVVTDQLPPTVTLKPGSASHPATVNGNVLTITLPDMPFDDVQTVTYKLSTPADKSSIRKWYDDVPNSTGGDIWQPDFIPTPTAPNPTNFFEVTETLFNSPEFSWFVPDIETESRQVLDLVEPVTITGSRPTLRFFHRYDTEFSADGGLVEIREEGSNNWQKLDSKFLRNGYDGLLQYGTFAEGNLYTFSGNSGPDFKDSYIDLSDWTGKEVYFRFRFGTDDNTTGPLGWVIDDFEMMDLLSYNGEACVTTAQGVNECVIAPEEGTIVESKLVSGTEETLKNLSMAVFPNPANDVLNISLDAANQQTVGISLVSVDGQLMGERKFSLQGKNTMQLQVGQLPAGFYFVKVSTDEGVMVRKVVVE